jgi:hypothetical protein
MNKNLITLLLATSMLVGLNAQAECILHSTSVSKVVGKVDEIADTRYMVGSTFNNERKCSTSSRVQYHGQWETVYGEYTGDPSIGDQELCLNAVELSVRQFLASKEDKLTHFEQQMVCTDEEPIKLRPVKLGEVIRESEVQPDPDNTFLFQYKGATCKRFIEPGTREGRDLYLWHGVICKLGRRDSDNWTVLDMY